MDANERLIYHYLKARRPHAVLARDISRHVGSKRKFRYRPEWVANFLHAMVERGILETDADACYRLKPIPPQETKGKRWASQEILQLLKASGKEVTHLVTPEDEDDYYEKL